MAVTEIDPSTGRDIWILPLEGEPFAFSPDGKWIAYQSEDSGRPEIYVEPFPSPGPRVAVSNEGGKAPVWSDDGTELFYRQETALLAVPVETTGGFHPGKPVRLIDGPYQADAQGHPNYDVSPDGERFLMIRREAGLTELHIVLNLAEELKARVRKN